MRRFLTVLLFSAIGAGAQAQRLDPGDYIYPIRDVARLYSANFGEMRPGHFHAGIDIKTDGAEGKPLVAVADGYVSRVSLAAGGYGRAVYLTLRNGTTAVYGHLQRFRDDIEEHVRQERTARRANGVNLFFGPETWPVKQGDVIGFSGDSGSSMGPHLHFEIRDTPTQRLYNVVREGVIRPEDDLPPRIMRLHYVEVDTLQGVPVRSRMESYAVVREAEGRYRLTREEPVGAGRKGYFVAEVTDRRIRIEAEDDCGNRSALEFTVRGRSESFRAEADTAAVALYPDRTSLVQVGREARASIPEGALYEPIFVKPERRETPQADSGVVVLSPAYRFLSPDTPLRHPAAVTVRTRVPRRLQFRTALAVRNRKGRLAWVGGSYANGAVTASTYATGDLVAVADTLAPAVRPLFAEGADLSKSESLRFRAADNFSGIASWTLRIDGEWVPCDRFPVKGTLVHFFDAPPQRRRHDVQLSVRDGCGNTAHFKGTFYR